MPNLNHALLRYFLPRLLARNAEATVPRSGPEGARINAFTVKTGEMPRARYVLTGMRGELVTALEHSGEAYSVDAVIPIGSIDPEALKVRHYYGLDTVDYTGIWAVALGRITAWPYARISAARLWNHIAQHVFNRRTLTTRRRSEILAEVVSLVEQGEPGVSAMALLSNRYGHRWASHPDWEPLNNGVEFHLDMLVDSGELRKAGHRYTPTGLALKALEETQEQERRHKANLRLQSALAALTLVAAAAAAVQANLVKVPTILDLTVDHAQRCAAASQPAS
ncbi:hypothetical protein ABIC94_005131 [Variovorax paradoxus]|uniref:hypothetical protein n=1 Tax=Variovorax paradoxus TaxID=34073 RepID=UPI0033981A8D